jgi:hypothetical protein
MLVCQDRPFPGGKLVSYATKQRLIYILFNAVTIGIMVLVGIIIIVPLLFL